MSSQEWKDNNQDKIKAYRLAWYYRNKQKQVDRQRETGKATKEWITGLKSPLSCEHCGFSFLGREECGDFHHIDPEEKDMNVSQMRRFSKKRILDEIEKCVALCANCHRTEHKNND